MKTEFYKHATRKTAELIPYANNSRTHSEHQVAQIAASIKEFGFTNPVLIDEKNGLIAGHGRVMAAQLLGLDKVPVIVLDGLSELQKQAYIISDNKLALNAGWDEEILKIELQKLEEAGFNLELTGFDADEIGIITEGWNSDINLSEKHGEHTDGIESKIIIKCAALDKDDILNLIQRAISESGIENVTYAG